MYIYIYNWVFGAHHFPTKTTTWPRRRWFYVHCFGSSKESRGACRLRATLQPANWERCHVCQLVVQELQESWPPSQWALGTSVKESHIDKWNWRILRAYQWVQDVVHQQMVHWEFASLLSSTFNSEVQRAPQNFQNHCGQLMQDLTSRKSMCGGYPPGN